jgi:predicted ribosome quality control (RQC) complex YloA/Tae2 family protein
VVTLDLEGFEASGDRARFMLAVSLKGRSSNLYLADSNSIVEQAWAERGVIAVGDKITIDEKPLTADELLCDFEETATIEEIVEKRFGMDSPLGTLLKKEFLFRCRATIPVVAFQSLVRQALDDCSEPTIYSKLSLDEVGSRPVDLRNDLLLSYFPLRLAEHLKRYEFETLSEAASRYARARDRAQAFQNRLGSLTRAIKSEIKKRASLIEELSRQESKHGDPERLKRYGDLLLANIATARVTGSKAEVTDYFDESQPVIEIDLPEGQSIQQSAAHYFLRYQKARRALSAIESQRRPVAQALASLSRLLARLEQEPTSDLIDEINLEVERTVGKKAMDPAPKKAAGERTAGRSFKSTDGYEIVVGRNDRENDQITFRLAKSTDIWLHAADYPGSHVVVRNPSRGEVPHRAVREAAEIAAFYSQAKRDAKVAVHYTQKKFVTKPPRSKPGLVRLSSFKTLVVEPSCKLEKIE